MSHIKHNAIIVTTCFDWRIKAAARKARKLGLQVLGPGKAVVNGYQSFLICPDGSKEGWSESNRGDEAREQFMIWLKAQRFEDIGVTDNSNPFEWVHVEFGEVQEGIISKGRTVRS